MCLVGDDTQKNTPAIKLSLFSPAVLRYKSHATLYKVNVYNIMI